MFRKFILLASVSLLLALFSGLDVAQAAFGISPPFIHADKLVAGSRYNQTIYLVRDDASKDLSVMAQLDIAERVRDWVSIDKGFNFTIPAGTRQFPIVISVNAPKSAERVSYKGTIDFTGAPAQAGQITIALGVQAIINIRVGDDIYREYLIPIVKTLDIEEGWNPRVFVKFQNDGNIPESLEAANFRLLNMYGGVTLAYTQKMRGFPETPPFTTKEYVIEFPIDFHLGLGQYWGDVQLFKDDKLLANQKATFQVLERGSLSTFTERFLRHLAGNWMYYAGGAVIIITLAIFSARRRKLFLTHIK